MQSFWPSEFLRLRAIDVDQLSNSREAYRGGDASALRYLPLIA
jgi:hypothetical protein